MSNIIPIGSSVTFDIPPGCPWDTPPLKGEGEVVGYGLLGQYTIKITGESSYKGSHLSIVPQYVSLRPVSNFTITKTQVECYKITSPRSGWADIVVDDNGKAGRIQIDSDYGSWQRYWGACGCPFKEFLVNLNLDYVAGKFGASKWFDHEATMQLLRKDVEGHVEGNVIVLFDEFDLEEELDKLEGCDDPQIFTHLMWNSSVFNEICEGGFQLQYDIEPGFKQFWTKLWPVFIDELENELNITI